MILNSLKSKLKELGKKKYFKFFIVAFIYALGMEIGKCYNKYGSLTYFNYKNIGWLIFQTFIFYILLVLGFILFKKLSKYQENLIIFDKHPFLLSFILVLSSSLFYLIFFYPGSMAYDGLWQLDFYYNILEFSNHHPAMLTLIMGKLMDIGRFIGNDNLGMFLYILPQMLINALTYGYVIKIMKKIETPDIWIFLSLIFYAFFPFLIINSITYIKDILFYLMFLLSFVYAYYHFYCDYNNNKRKYFILSLFLIGLYLTRNTGYYIILIMLLSIMIFLRKKREALLGLGAIFIFFIGLNMVYHNIFLVKMNIKEGSIREAMSIPLQQTGRYLRDYPNDLTDKERMVLENIFSTNLTKLGTLYDVNRSDNIKWEFKKYPTNQELKSYLEVWYSMFLRHPFCYIDATLNNIYGYFYPGVQNFIGEELGFYGIDVGGEVGTGYFTFTRNNLEEGRNVLYRIASGISLMPIGNLFYTPAFYVWILIGVSFMLVFIKRKEVLLFIIPCFVVLGFCLISPVNGHMRYLQPVLVSMPFLVAILLKEMQNIKD